MQDRVPTPGQEGRVLITPENGSSPFYAKVEMADNPTQAGTPLNKATLLQDATAELFGLGADAVPDDVFSVIKNLVNSVQSIANGKAEIEAISYVGNGSSSKTITFSSPPSILVITGLTSNSYWTFGIFAQSGYGITVDTIKPGQGSEVFAVYTNWAGTSVTISGDFSDRLNIAQYNYIAYGIF